MVLGKVGMYFNLELSLDNKTRATVWENGGEEKYDRNTDFKEFKKKVWEVNHPGQPLRMGGAGGNNNNNRNDMDVDEEEEEEEELVMLDHHVNFKCPLTVKCFCIVIINGRSQSLINI